MGSSLGTTLMYGYDLGGEDGWKFNRTGKYDTDWPSWVKLVDGYPDPEEDGFIEMANEYLLKTFAGFTEEYNSSQSWFDRKQAAEAAVGLNLLSFDCRGTDYTDLWSFGVCLGSGYSLLEIKPEWLDPATLRHYDALIDRAMGVMELRLDRAEQPHPRILATASYC